MLLKLCGKKKYAEISQTSPVKFSVGEQVSDEVIEMQFWWINCRDFLNEYCLKQTTGEDAYIYQFDTSTIKQLSGDNSIYILAKGVRKKKTVTKVVEEFTGKESSTVKLPGNVLAFQVPLDLFCHTVLVSYLTHLIRFVDEYGTKPFKWTVPNWGELETTNEKNYAVRLVSTLGHCHVNTAKSMMKWYYDHRTGMGQMKTVFDLPCTTLHNNGGMLGALAANYGNLKTTLQGLI